MLPTFRGLATEHEKVLAQEGLYSGQTEMVETRAIVQKCGDARQSQIGAIAQVNSLERARAW
jgi:hypothetical protein